SDVRSLAENMTILHHSPMDSTHFIERLTGMDPLAPVSYRLLACQALENAADIDVPAETARGRVGALERERIASHLGWLALFGQQTGFDWLMQHAISLQLKCRHASLEQVTAIKPSIQALIKRLQHTLLLKSRTAGIGLLMPDAKLCGPVARAAGMHDDARSADKTFTALGFTAASRKDGDAFARLHLRLDEITHSLMLIEAAGTIAPPVIAATIGDASGTGESVVETPRGPARLQLTLEKGQVTAAQLETPSTSHLGLIEPLIEQQELGDALVAVGSLDLSPWEVRQ
ncbi:Lead, cadmium, zinc and mercury transporting ATPase; Copper-translocating P-type ATPase, partial [hydrothermal vent metagenome]